MGEQIKVLLVEDQAIDAELCEHELTRAGFRFTSRRVCTRAAFQQALSDFPPDVILSDFSMPTDLDGIGALAVARARVPDVPFVFVSGTIGEERAVEAMKAGATDYVIKDKLERLGPVVRRALQEARDRRAVLHTQDALRVSEARFRSFMEYLPGQASIRDDQGRYTFVNQMWEASFGLPAAQVLGKRSRDLPGESGDDLDRAHRSVLESNKAVSGVLKKRGASGETWWLSHHFPITAGATGTMMVGTIAIDVTEQKLQEQKIARLSRIHAVLSGINSAIVRIRDTQTLLDETCRIAVEDGGFGTAWIGTVVPETGIVTPVASAGLAPGEHVTQSALVINGKPHAHGVITRMIQSGKPEICNDLTRGLDAKSPRRREAVRRGYRSVVALPLLIGGSVAGTICLYSREVESFNRDELKLLMQLAADVSFALEYIDKDRKLQYLAWNDPVTGLANHALLHERLEYAVQGAQRDDARVAVVMWDINRFRTVNDTFGREAGDDLLRQVSSRAARMWPAVRHMARISADCFGGFVEGVKEPSDIAHWLEASEAVLNEPFALDGAELRIGVTTGIAFYPADGTQAETLLANAEAALKQAKRRGERYAFYEPVMNARVAEKLTLESRLRRALEKEQFVLHYQSKVDLATGTVCGLEALIRWQEPDGQLVPPMQFIPLLEETGLILEVGRWAIRKALHDWADRFRRGLPTPRIAVNVSAIQLRRNDFVDVVAKALAEIGVDRHGLDLEITESLLMENIGTSIGKLHALQEMGVNVAIDDFGTGYSSLSYLTRLPIKALKIDRSFIMTMVDEPESMSIVSTIISLAHALRLNVIAEGVETPEQSKLLRLIKCDEAQGYLFSKPVAWERYFDGGTGPTQR
jgi:diguanylate cyclase (GGDEF)-like protein/PAS domain S-box-containing protein